MVSEGLIEMMVEIFVSSNDEDLIKACLRALKRILAEGAEMGETDEDNPYYVRLQQCDGITVLDKMQNYASDDIFKAIESILDNNDNSDQD